MSDQYVPTTEEVLDGYVKQMTHWTSPQQADEWQAEFDRWLNAVKAEVWERGHVCGYSDAQDAARHIIRPPHNPYREGETP